MEKILKKGIFKVIEHLTKNDLYLLDNITVQKICDDYDINIYYYSLFYCGFWKINIYPNDNITADRICHKDHIKSCPDINDVVSYIQSESRKKKIENILKNT